MLFNVIFPKKIVWVHRLKKFRIYKLSIEKQIQTFNLNYSSYFIKKKNNENNHWTPNIYFSELATIPIINEQSVSHR